MADESQYYLTLTLEAAIALEKLLADPSAGPTRKPQSLPTISLDEFLALRRKGANQQ